MKTEKQIRERLAALQAAYRDPRDRTIEADARINAGCRTLRWVLGELEDV